MTEQALELLVDPEGMGGPELGGVLAKAWPQERALHIALALTMAARHIESTLRDGDVAAGAARGYRCAALLAAEVAALETELGGQARCADLTQQRLAPLEQ